MNANDAKKLTISELEYYVKIVLDRAMDVSQRISQIDLVDDAKKHSQLRADLLAQTSLANTISGVVDKMRAYQMSRVRFEFSMLQAKTDHETMSNFLEQAEKDTVDDYE